MLEEAREAADLVHSLLSKDIETYQRLGEQLREWKPAFVATVARGSSDHAATYASYLIPYSTGQVVASVAPSLVSVLGSKLDLNGQFVLAISQSGRSPDIISTVAAAKESGALTAAIVNDLQSPVSAQVDYVLPQHAGTEGIAATKTVLCSLAAIARLTAEWTQDKKFLQALQNLPQHLSHSYGRGMELDDSFLKGISSAYVLSRGLGLSTALETALKLKETCGIHAEAFSTAELRHGPREIVDQDFAVIAIALPGTGHADVLGAAEEMKAQGARVMILDLSGVDGASDARLSPLLALQTLYPWLARSSRTLGLDPDRPRTLKSKVIQTV